MVDVSISETGSLFEPEDSAGRVSLESAIFFETPAEIFGRIHREIKPRTAVPSVSVEYKPFADPNSRIQLHDGRLTVTVSDLFEGAPAPVIEALAHILLNKLYRKVVEPRHTRRYRLYLNRKDIRARIDASRRERGRKNHSGPQGKVHDLDALFDELNHAHFGGMMAKPKLGWSHVRSKNRLGHYDPSHHTIVISRVFDDPRNPKLALEYVLFHEMLHLHYPVEHGSLRRCVHTKEFRAHEEQFPGFHNAKAMLRKLR